MGTPVNGRPVLHFGKAEQILIGDKKEVAIHTTKVARLAPIAMTDEKIHQFFAHTTDTCKDTNTVMSWYLQFENYAGIMRTKNIEL